jgi:hypothetical protein
MLEERCRGRAWWAWVDLNYRPHAYQACALTGLSYRPTEDHKAKLPLQLLTLDSRTSHIHRSGPAARAADHSSSAPDGTELLGGGAQSAQNRARSLKTE